MPPLKARPPAARPCHNCRRQRWKCDRSEPHCTKCVSRGIKCLGYGQLLLWTGGVASRGKLAGSASISTLRNDLSTKRADDELAVAHPGTEMESRDEDTTIARGRDSLRRIALTDFNMTAPWVLVDPLFQDLRPSHRRYLDYCAAPLPSLCGIYMI